MTPEVEHALVVLAAHGGPRCNRVCRPALAIIRKALEVARDRVAVRDQHIDALKEELKKALEARGHAQRIQIRFDGPPGPEAGRFVEVETLDGKSISIGEWLHDGDYWLLRLPDPRCQPEAPAAHDALPAPPPLPEALPEEVVACADKLWNLFHNGPPSDPNQDCRREWDQVARLVLADRSRALDKQASEIMRLQDELSEERADRSARLKAVEEAADAIHGFCRNAGRSRHHTCIDFHKAIAAIVSAARGEGEK